MSLRHDVSKDIKKRHFFLLFMVIASMMLYQISNRPIGVVHRLMLPYEAGIPLIREFVIIYHACYPFVFINLVLFLILNKVLFVESGISITLGNILAFFTYLMYQTEVPRPEIIGNDLFSQLLRLTYRMDNPFNGFPSQHVITTTIILIAIWRSNSSKKYKIFSSILCAMILLSTLFIKQHTLLDVLGGVVYGSLSYVVVAYVIKIKPKKGNI